jgi:hypothetical protein
VVDASSIEFADSSLKNESISRESGVITEGKLRSGNKVVVIADLLDIKNIG